LKSRNLEQIPSEKILLIAEDLIEAKTAIQKAKAAKSLEKLNKKGKCSETANLADTIEIKKDAKIMLLRNLDVASGLVNGAIGIIKKLHETVNIVNARTCKNLVKLSVQFEENEFEIERIESKFQLNNNIFLTIRKQLPICLAYAITIHKSQGLTITSGVVDIGDSIFADGQTCVALSRLKTLSGLHILNLNPKSIKTHDGAIIEYNRLRPK